MAVTLKALEISRTQGGSYTRIQTPTAVTVGWQTLDSQKSGRDNNTGAMFRDKVAEKLPIKFTLPYGLKNDQVADLLDIIAAADFWVKAPNPRTGAYGPIHVYCAGCEPPIAQITDFNSSGEPTAWIYDAFELNFVEM